MFKKIFYLMRAAFAVLFSCLHLRLLESPWRFIGKCIQNAENHNFSKNGEERLITKFLELQKNKASLAVYDIGANIGKWSEEIVKRRSDAYICAFEMIPAFAARAKERLNSYKNVQVFNVPLSDEEMDLEVFQHGGGASVTDNPYHPVEAKKHALRSKHGDRFINENNLPAPAFIKIDVDGHEMKVLKGLRGTIAAARPWIQFEYSFYYVHERVYLKDMFAFFEALDYELFQIFPTKLIKRSYKPSLENFWTVNYLARPKEKPDF